jgi:hypothetical protein
VLLAAALRVVAGIGLVERKDEELDGRQRQVDVDPDPAGQVAEVVARRPPGLVVHHLEDDVLSVRQLDEATGPGARLLDDSRDQALCPVGGHEARAFPARVALGQRPVAGE